ncbi:MAG: hypothetical protein ACXV5T_09080 [Halobacteriota archaeon]
MITVSESFDTFCANSECNDLAQRLSAIESQIEELKSLILKNESEDDADREKKRPRARFEPASCPPQRQSNRAYVLMHGVSGVDWVHYEHLLPEHVHDVYMKSWGDVQLAFGQAL